jgi:hypothetical protein
MHYKQHIKTLVIKLQALHLQTTIQIQSKMS